MFKVEYKHNPFERALNCSIALGIHLNIDYQSYGGTESLRAMIEAGWRPTKEEK